MKNCGIYKITSPSGRVYIGQSTNIKERFKNYSNPNRIKSQTKLYNSLKKYGVENHQFDIIEYCSEEDLNCSERFWQDEFDVLGQNGLNCSLQNCGEVRKVITEEMKIKISNSSKSKGSHRRGNNPKAKIVLDTQTGIYYDCLKDACEALCISYKSAVVAVNNSNNIRNNTQLVYIDDCESEVYEVKDKYFQQCIRIINVDTNEEYKSIKEASIKTKLNYSNLRNIFQGRVKNNTNLQIKSNEL